MFGLLVGTCVYCVFFFSSRRRHTRWPRDWSSDVCSSDLNRARCAPVRLCWLGCRGSCSERGIQKRERADQCAMSRSEERRVGKECRCRGGTEKVEKKEERGSREDVKSRRHEQPD